MPGSCVFGKTILLAMNWCLQSWVEQSGTFAFDGRGALRRCDTDAVDGGNPAPVAR